MTLIQTVATNDITILVADRRLTHPATGQPVDDAFTKLVCWNMSYGIGFTGLARIDPAQRKPRPSGSRKRSVTTPTSCRVSRRWGTSCASK